MKLVDKLIEEEWLKSPEIIGAFRKIKREDFILEDKREIAELNEALPIGFGQTISQPLTVAFMLELLQPKPGDKILDVGAGSGWTAAILAEIAGPKGKVVAMEIIPELVEFGKNNVAKYGFIESETVDFILGNGSLGFKKEAPYDKILVSASGKKAPEELKKQLKINGRLVCCIENSIWLFIKKNSSLTNFGDKKSEKKSEKKINAPKLVGDKNEFEQKEYPGFVFVPLVK